jgi:hypothetical protein
MKDDVVKCPLCGAFAPNATPELLAALRNPQLRQRTEQFVAELLQSPLEEATAVGAERKGRDFQKDVHSWNPCVPMWRRSPKE